MTELWLFRVRIRIHLLFWAVIGLSIATGYFIEVITLFVIVLIHELGHVAVAREVGWKITEIQLLPFGGVASVEDEASAEPLDEIVVALAGPFMNMAMIFISFLFWWSGLWTTEWTAFFMKSNLLVAGFNLIPIWPLDGGRIVQALLTFVLPYRQASYLSLGSSCLFSALLFGVGLIDWQVNLMTIGAYLAIVNIQAFLRFPYQFMRFLMGKYLRESDRLRIQSIPVEPTMSTIQAAYLMYKGCSHLFFVRTDSAGVFIHESELLHALLIEQRHQESIGKILS
ncbi:M50 family metallopeptidase [Brevibacillus ginsengisoli]|uniref:M50 family metallopeptidase n=1 Tax=Brevibacillus ginsengisoli TaxID=363854 RepID=UPI003CF20488